MTIAIIIAVLVVAALGLFFAFSKSKPALPPAESHDEPRTKAQGIEPSIERASNKRVSVKASAARVSSVAEVASANVMEASEPPPPMSRQVSADEVRGLRKGLGASRGGFIARLASLFVGKRELDPNLVEQLEEIMLSSDVGAKTTQLLLERVREGLERKALADRDAVWGALRAQANAILDLGSYRMPWLIPLTVYTGVVPISGVLIVLFCVEQIINGVGGGYEGPEDAELLGGEPVA